MLRHRKTRQDVVASTQKPYFAFSRELNGLFDWKSFARAVQHLLRRQLGDENNTLLSNLIESCAKLHPDKQWLSIFLRERVGQLVDLSVPDLEGIQIFMKSDDDFEARASIPPGTRSEDGILFLLRVESLQLLDSVSLTHAIAILESMNLDGTLNRKENLNHSTSTELTDTESRAKLRYLKPLTSIASLNHVWLVNLSQMDPSTLLALLRFKSLVSKSSYNVLIISFYDREMPVSRDQREKNSVSQNVKLNECEEHGNTDFEELQSSYVAHPESSTTRRLAPSTQQERLEAATEQRRATNAGFATAPLKFANQLRACPHHPSRNNESCPRECEWQIEGLNELAVAIEPFEISPTAHASSSLQSQSRRKLQRFLTTVKHCHLLIILGALTITVSLGIGLWRSSYANDLSGGFSLAQYILGVGIFIVGSMVALHAKRCTCWQFGRAARV